MYKQLIIAIIIFSTRIYADQQTLLDAVKNVDLGAVKALTTDTSLLQIAEVNECLEEAKAVLKQLQNPHSALDCEDDKAAFYYGSALMALGLYGCYKMLKRQPRMDLIGKTNGIDVIDAAAFYMDARHRQPQFFDLFRKSKVKESLGLKEFLAALSYAGFAFAGYCWLLEGLNQECYRAQVDKAELICAYLESVKKQLDAQTTNKQSVIS